MPRLVWYSVHPDTALHSSCPSMAICSERFEHLGHFLFFHWSLLDQPQIHARPASAAGPGVDEETTGTQRRPSRGFLDPELSRTLSGIHSCLQKCGDPHTYP